MLLKCLAGKMCSVGLLPTTQSSSLVLAASLQTACTAYVHDKEGESKKSHLGRALGEGCGFQENIKACNMQLESVTIICLYSNFDQTCTAVNVSIDGHNVSLKKIIKKNLEGRWVYPKHKHILTKSHLIGSTHSRSSESFLVTTLRENAIFSTTISLYAASQCACKRLEWKSMNEMKF